MTKEEYRAIKYGNDQNLINRLNSKVNEILCNDPIGDGINRCQSPEQVEQFIQVYVIPWIDTKKLKTQ